MKSPLIADIKRHSLEDGPGIRSVVFFKGCPLRCRFCHNPEMLDPRPHIVFSKKRCISCGECVRACPAAAVHPATREAVDTARCTRCGACARACPSGALKFVGTAYSVEKLASILLRDMPYYLSSHGGVTFSGGECTLYPEYLHALAGLLKTHDVSIVLETSGYFDYGAVSRHVLPFIDMVYFDIKVLDAADHIALTGKSNRKILDNFRRLVRDLGAAVLPRIPLIPGITDSESNLRAALEFLVDAGASRCALLPYNPMGVATSGTILDRELYRKFADSSSERAICELVRDIIARIAGAKKPPVASPRAADPAAHPALRDSSGSSHGSGDAASLSTANTALDHSMAST